MSVSQTSSDPGRRTFEDLWIPPQQIVLNTHTPDILFTLHFPTSYFPFNLFLHLWHDFPSSHNWISIFSFSTRLSPLGASSTSSTFPPHFVSHYFPVTLLLCFPSLLPDLLFLFKSCMSLSSLPFFFFPLNFSTRTFTPQMSRTVTMTLIQRRAWRYAHTQFICYLLLFTLAKGLKQLVNCRENLILELVDLWTENMNCSIFFFFSPRLNFHFDLICFAASQPELHPGR